ncbi:hypothetical protein Tco_0496686 [Tanacetum coccineum]
MKSPLKDYTYCILKLGVSDQAAVPSEAMEEREEEEVPLRRKRSVYRRARIEFHTPAFEQFHTPLSADVLSQAAVSESAERCSKSSGKFSRRDRLVNESLLFQRLRAEDLAKEDLPNVSEERAKELDDLMMRMTETDWLNLMNTSVWVQIPLHWHTEKLLGSGYSTDSSSPSPVSYDHYTFDVLFEPYQELDSSFGVSNISGAGVVGCGKLPDVEIVDPTGRGIVEDFFSSESESDDDMENYIPPIPYGGFKDWEIEPRMWMLGYGPWRDVNMYVSVPSFCMMWKVLDEPLDEWVVYPIRATLLERMLRHRLTVPPSYCRDVVVAGNVIQTVQAGLRESYECLASVPIACTARQMVFSSPWLTAKKESGSPLQTALVCNSNPLMVARVFVFTKVSTSPRVSSYLVKASQIYLCCCKDWKLLLRDVAASFDSAVHHVHAGSFDAAVASLVSACVAAAAYFVPAAFQSSCFEKIYLETWN